MGTRGQSYAAMSLSSSTQIVHNALAPRRPLTDPRHGHPPAGRSRPASAMASRRRVDPMAIVASQPVFPMNQSIPQQFKTSTRPTSAVRRRASKKATRPSDRPASAPLIRAEPTHANTRAPERIYRARPLSAMPSYLESRTRPVLTVDYTQRGDIYSTTQGKGMSVLLATTAFELLGVRTKHSPSTTTRKAAASPAAGPRSPGLTGSTRPSTAKGRTHGSFKVKKKGKRPASAHPAGGSTQARPATHEREPMVQRYMQPTISHTMEPVYGHLVPVPASQKAELIESKLLNQDVKTRIAGLKELSSFETLHPDAQQALLEMGIVSVVADMIPKLGMKRHEFLAPPVSVYSALRGILNATVVPRGDVCEFMGKDCGVLGALLDVLPASTAPGISALLIDLLRDSFIVQTEFRLLGGIDICASLITTTSATPRARATALIILGQACNNNRESLEAVSDVLFDRILSMVGDSAPAYRTNRIREDHSVIALSDLTPMTQREAIPPNLMLRLYAAEFLALAALENSAVLTRLVNLVHGVSRVVRVLRSEKNTRMALLADNLEARTAG
ncbi:hypothetical protein J8273_0936 [Carpediemonas membranifera]|uniref:Uncharacterized protein n=1 Tax=Carpediemonas membranifera TaxID=201153 RepID=A0A8J6AXR2_9EUKA|nr:hypothetical protein J8273_0936 [Carpediemonas membranifera]|eukprot:KAG9397441.1 hypothetical protein J8273_0936 [Carpediemonas membranifera]